MKIVLVIDIYDLMTNGTVMTAYRFVEGLRKRGHEVRVVATGAKGEGCYEVRERYIPLVTEVSRLQQIRFGKPETPILTNAFSGADIIHFYLPFKLEKKGRKIAEIMDIPATAAFHLQPENITYNSGLKHSRIMPKILYAGFKNTFYKHFEHIHCPSKFIADQMRKHGYQSKLHVISNGVGAEFCPDPGHKKAEDRFNILMIGRYANEKRQDVLIKAIAQSKYKDKIYLTLAGKGPNFNRLSRIADKYLPDRVRFGFFKKEELIEVIRSSHLYVHAADIEIEAIACLEAIACGTVPVISNSDKSATPQFALDDRSLFKAGSVKSLAEKIDYWIEHPEERERMSEVYAQSAKVYSLDYSLDKAEEMFREAINSHRDKKKFATKEGKQKSRKFVKKSRLFKFCSNLFYYLIALPCLYIYEKTVYGLKIRGKRNVRKVRKTGAVSVSNHVHLLDCAKNAIAMYPRHVIFTALPSNFEIPVAGKLLTMLGSMPVPDKIADVKVFLNEVKKLVKIKKRIVHIYPEAHLINYYAGIRSFEKGAFTIACDAQVPILPLVISWRERRGLFKLFLKNKPLPTISIGKPIYPNLSLMAKDQIKDLSERTRKAMEDIYTTSNNGSNVDYFRGKAAPQEFHTKYDRPADDE